MEYFFGLQVDQISPGFSERYLLDPTRFGAELLEYRRYIEDVLKVFLAHSNQTVPPGTPEEMASDVLTFSTQLASVRKSCPVTNTHLPFPAWYFSFEEFLFPSL